MKTEKQPLDAADQSDYELAIRLKEFTLPEIEEFLSLFREHEQSYHDFHTFTMASPGSFAYLSGEFKSDEIRKMQQSALKIPTITDELRDEILAEPMSTQKQEKAPPQKGFVYLMRDNRSGYHKIGFSVNPSFREATLQAQQPDITMVANGAGTLNDEKMLHAAFSEKRIRGEWFDLSGSEISEVLKILGCARW